VEAGDAGVRRPSAASRTGPRRGRAGRELEFAGATEKETWREFVELDLLVDASVEACEHGHFPPAELASQLLRIEQEVVRLARRAVGAST
jgi:hypothetical protein